MKTETATIAILKDLVAFDTTSRLSNIPLLDYAIEILRRNGIEPELIWNDDRTKANLWASIGPQTSGGIILSGHTDTVPVDGQEWSADPFRLEERDSRLLRHERFCRGRAGKGSRYGGGRSQTTDPHRLLP
jgi:acetylornithine deacetylase